MSNRTAFRPLGPACRSSPRRSGRGRSRRRRRRAGRSGRRVDVPAARANPSTPPPVGPAAPWGNPGGCSSSPTPSTNSGSSTGPCSPGAPRRRCRARRQTRGAPAHEAPAAAQEAPRPGRVPRRRGGRRARLVACPRTMSVKLADVSDGGVGRARADRGAVRRRAWWRARRRSRLPRVNRRRGPWGLRLEAVSPLHVAAYIRTHPGSAPTVKHHRGPQRQVAAVPAGGGVDREGGGGPESTRPPGSACGSARAVERPARGRGRRRFRGRLETSASPPAARRRLRARRQSTANGAGDAAREPAARRPGDGRRPTRSTSTTTSRPVSGTTGRGSTAACGPCGRTMCSSSGSSTDSAGTSPTWSRPGGPRRGLASARRSFFCGRGGRYL